MDSIKWSCYIVRIFGSRHSVLPYLTFNSIVNLLNSFIVLHLDDINMLPRCIVCFVCFVSLRPQVVTFAINGSLW